MIDFYNKYAGNIKFSQNGEEKLLLECIHRMQLKNGTAYTGNTLEIGGNDGRWLSNTALLIENNWGGHFVEADYNLHLKSKANWAHRQDVKHTCSFVDEKNCNAFITDLIDIVSIDTDGADYKILQAMTARPRILIIEIDSSIPPDRDEFNKDGGSGYLPMLRLALDKNYFLLCHTGNLVLVDKKYRKLFPEIKGSGVENYSDYFRKDWLR